MFVVPIELADVGWTKPWVFAFPAIPLILLAAVALGAALLLWRRQGCAPSARAGGWLMAATLPWLLCYALELLSHGLQAKLFWAQAEYLGLVLVPPAWLILVLCCTGRQHWLSRRVLALLAIDPVITVLLAWTTG